LKLGTLGSGSSGNCTYIAGDQGAVLIDGGLSARVIEERLKTLDLKVEDIKAVFLTHEHQDHWKGLPKLCRDFDLPLYSGQATYDCLADKFDAGLQFHPVHEGDIFQLWGLTIKSYGLLHDAAEPYCYSVAQGDCVVAVVTDLGAVDERVARLVSRVDALVFEANYDRQMLQSSKYPQHLKNRISGGLGHLANDIAASFLAEHLDWRCQLLLMAHLSENANSPQKALMTFREFLLPRLKENLNLGIAPRHESSGLLNLSPLPPPDMKLLRHSA
jgi:phosphoribosyl 1,2-cyclic phosphodiesterase